MNDITTFIDFFITIFIEIWDWVFETLNNIKLFGTSLYWIVIISIILRIAIPIVVQLHNDEKEKNVRTNKERKKKNGK